jgi:hypothetical protein
MSFTETEAIKITGVITEEVGEPRNDGTSGSALYAVPFRLSRAPSPTWVRAFLETWEWPPRFTSMHRPGIARVRGDRIILDGTTIEEVERYHLETLKLAVREANRIEDQEVTSSKKESAAHRLKRQEHRKKVENIASRLRF